MIELVDGVIYFDDGIPSNFYPAPIRLWDSLWQGEQTFPGNEWYFQAAKISLAGDFTVTIDGMLYDPYRLFDEIAHAETANQAKRFGRRVPLDKEDIRDWNNGIALIKMLECNIAKYTQVDYCRTWLLSTEDHRLVEHRKDKIWGDNIDGTGRNLLGKTLELVRNLVR